MFPTGVLMERAASFHSLLFHASRVPHKSSPEKYKFYPSLEGPRKGTSPHVPKNGVPMATDSHFQSLTYHNPSGSSLKEPSLQVPLTELRQ